jgi:hypothetical protein
MFRVTFEMRNGMILQDKQEFSKLLLFRNVEVIRTKNKKQKEAED